MVLIIILIIVGFLIYFLVKRKKIKLNNLVVINGGVKSGKTTLSVYLAISQHRKALLKFYIDKYILFKKNVDKPLLYSNIPLKYKYYIPLSKEVILQQKRIAFGSIVLLSEASLVANAQEFRDDELNERVMWFCKMFAHMSHNGYMFIETQTMSDLHHQLKKNFNNYLYIYHCDKMIPFLLRFQVREMLYSYDDKSINNNFDEDIEKSMLNLFCFKSVWKRFDRWTYSKLTDNLDYDCVLLSKEQIEKLELKTTDIISFNHYKYINLKGDNKNE